MPFYTNNYAPAPRKSQVAHQPGQKDGEKIKDGRDYIVEFQDDLLSTQGWSNPRLDGCEINGLVINKFSQGGTPKQLGGIKSPNIQHLVNITQSWEGDSGNFDKNPVVETHTNTIFFGATIAGFQEDKRFPNVGPDFSYIFLSKAYTFNPHDDTFFITEMLGPEDEVFERILKQDMSYASKFTFKILDEGTEHDLKDEYNVHFNAGLFSLMGTFITCSESPFSQEMQLTTQYSGKNANPPTAGTDYYGVGFNPYKTNNYTQNNVPFLINSHERKVLTGSFTVETNIDTWWWRRPKTSSYFDVGPFFQTTNFAGVTSTTNFKIQTQGSASAAHNSASGAIFFDNGSESLHVSGNLENSLYGFFFRLIGTNHKNIDTDFKFDDPDENAEYGIAPAKQDLHILTFNEAEGCIRDIQTELRYTRNTTQVLRHFGSISLSPARKIPVPNTANQQARLNFEEFSLNARVVGPAFEEYVLQEDFGSFGSPTATTPSPGSSAQKYYHWFVNGPIEDNETGRYGGNQTFGKGNMKGAPVLRTFTVSKLIKRKNVIMVDINKAQELFDGIGGSGFICIPENINPQIKNNLDYYLKKAELIEKGPNRKGLAAKAPRIIRKPKPLKNSHLFPRYTKGS